MAKKSCLKLVELKDGDISYVSDTHTICWNTPRLLNSFFSPKSLDYFYEGTIISNSELFGMFKEQYKNAIATNQYENIIGSMELNFDGKPKRWVLITDNGKAFYCFETDYEFYNARKFFDSVKVCRLERKLNAFVFEDCGKIKVISVIKMSEDDCDGEVIEFKIALSL